MLVVSSHGHGSLKRMFLGSVSNFCVNNLHVPVLVMRDPERERDSHHIL